MLGLFVCLLNCSWLSTLCLQSTFLILCVNSVAWSDGKPSVDQSDLWGEQHCLGILHECTSKWLIFSCILFLTPALPNNTASTYIMIIHSLRLWICCRWCFLWLACRWCGWIYFVCVWRKKPFSSRLLSRLCWFHARCRSAGLPNQRPDLLFQEDGGALSGSCTQQHGVRPAGCQCSTQASHHPECCHIPR